MNWTEQNTELLLKLWNEGHSGSFIANALGGGCTRNAVIGKLHRSGAYKRQSVTVSNGAAPRRHRARPQPSAPPTFDQWEHGTKPPRPHNLQNWRGGALPLKAKYEPQLPAPIPAPIPSPVQAKDTKPIFMLMLREGMCKYAIGEIKGSHHFCGAKSDGPWCDFHRAKMFQPLNVMRQR